MILSGSFSSPASLTVTLASKATYLGSTITTPVRAGFNWQVDVRLRNDGDSFGFLWAELFDYETGAYLDGGVVPADPGVTQTIPLTGYMPTKDLVAYVMYGHTNDPVVVPGVMDGQGNPFTIDLLLSTSLDLVLNPSTVPKGGLVEWIGHLYTSLPLPLPNETIYLDKLLAGGGYQFNVANAKTNQYGEFLGQFTAPTEAGTHSYRVRVDQRVLGMILEGSVSDPSQIIIELASYQLQISSDPLGIPFIMDDIPGYATPFNADVPEGQHVIVVPDQIDVAGVTYYFQKWENNNANPARTITLDKATSLSALYSTEPPSNLSLYLTGAVVVAAVGAAYYYSKKK